MPYFGAGVDQHVNVPAAPTWVFTPTPGVTATARFVNEGSQVVYIGGAGVTPTSGLPLLPNTRVELPSVNVTLYACSGVSPTALNSTTLSGAQTAGASALTAASNTGIGVGSTLQVDTGANTEYLVVSTDTGGTIATTTPFLYSHVTGVAVKNVSPNVALLRVAAGVV